MRSAALASCAIPGVFAPVELMAKVCLMAQGACGAAAAVAAQAPDGTIRVYIPGGLRWTDGQAYAHGSLGRPAMFVRAQAA